VKTEGHGEQEDSGDRDEGRTPQMNLKQPCSDVYLLLRLFCLVSPSWPNLVDSVLEAIAMRNWGKRTVMQGVQ
jgi:hypothetical protein